MILTDGTHTVEITMYGEDHNDWSADFFDAGLLPYDEEIGAHRVKNVAYCIEQAEDWRDGIGDYPNEYNEERHITVDDVH